MYNFELFPLRILEQPFKGQCKTKSPIIDRHVLKNYYTETQVSLTFLPEYEDDNNASYCIETGRYGASGSLPLKFGVSNCENLKQASS